MNALVGEKVAIASSRPQTTRNALRGILNRESVQIIFVDTPGLHKAVTPLGRRLNSLVSRTISEVDVGVFVGDASEQIGTGDFYAARQILDAGIPALCVLNKADKVQPPRLLEQIEAAAKLGAWVEVLTTSARRKTGLNFLVDAIVKLLPVGPALYPQDMVSDQPEELAIAEIIREKVLELTREEIPHSVAVQIEEMEQRENSDIFDVFASIYVERDSQKGILIGRGGKMLKEVGSRARVDLEARVGGRVFLDLRVKVADNWQRDERALDDFGY